MILHRLLVSIAGMALAYFISIIFHDAARSLEKSGKHPFLCQVCVVIYYFASLCSLFVGLFFYLRGSDSTD